MWYLNWGEFVSNITAAAAEPSFSTLLHHKSSQSFFLSFLAQFLSDVLKIWNYMVQHHFKCIFQMCTDESSRSMLDHLVCSK